MTKETSIQDLFGIDIYPGHLIAIRRSSKGYEHELSIVTSFDYRGTRRFWSANGPAKVVSQKIIRLVRIDWKGEISKGWLEISEGFHNDIIVINPSKAFLALNNSKIKKLLNIVDKAKDKKILPQSYKLGKPFVHEQIFPEVKNKP